MKKLPLHTRIFIGMLLGIIAGLIVQNSGLPDETIDSIVSWVKPLGDIFLRMIFMMVIPLIISGLALGIADLGDLKKIGRIGLITLGFTVVLTAVSVFIGIGMAETFSPGRDLSESDRQMLIERFGSNSADIEKTAATLKSRNILETLVVIIPKNPLEDAVRAFDPTYTGGGLLAVMFFTVILGISLALADKEKTEGFKKFLEGLFEVTMKAIDIAMKLAPIGVAALLFAMMAKMGLSIFFVLIKYVMVVIAALAIHMFVSYPVVLKVFCRTNPVEFFRNIREVLVTAFSTSSSNATLPTSIRVANEKLKLPRNVSNFVLTVGSTANQNGTALYEGISVLFLAQVFGIPLDLQQQIFIVLICVISGIGTAGVPGGSLPIVMLILISVGIPGESIAIILGVDRLLDMCRTTLNVAGDLVAATFVAKMEAKAT